MSELIVKGVIAYLLGSLVGSLLIGAIRGVDIRKLGSGNAGATNALRTQGKAIGLTVLIIDLAKGWLATAWLAPASLPWVAPTGEALHAWAIPVCGLLVMLGHIYPVWFQFRGGKGVATLVGVILGISASLLLAFVATFFATVILLGYVGLASILGTVAVAASVALGHLEPHAPLLTFAVLAALLVIFTHRGNIARMRAGTEPRSKRLWLFRPRETA